MELLGYVGALLMGIILGLTGGGGSIITVPILVYVLNINPIVSTAYSLFIVGTTSTFGAIHNYYKGLVEIKTGFLFAIPSFIAVFLTRKFLVPLLPKTIFTFENLVFTRETFLMILFAFIMIFAALAVVRKKKNETIVQNENSKTTLILKNFSIGILIGLVGAGGGFLIIPSLLFFAKLPLKKAVATSLFIISLNSLIGFIGDIQNLTIDWYFLIKFTGISVLGIFIGIYLNKFINENQLKKTFAYFVISMAIFILIKEIYDVTNIT